MAVITREQLIKRAMLNPFGLTRAQMAEQAKKAAKDKAYVAAKRAVNVVDKGAEKQFINTITKKASLKQRLRDFFYE